MITAAYTFENRGLSRSSLFTSTDYMTARPRNILLFPPSSILLHRYDTRSTTTQGEKKNKEKVTPGMSSKEPHRLLEYKTSPQTPLPQPSPNLSNAFIKPTRALDFRCPLCMISFSPRKGPSPKKKKNSSSKNKKKFPNLLPPLHPPPRMLTQTGTIPLLQSSQMKKESNECRHR